MAEREASGEPTIGLARQFCGHENGPWLRWAGELLSMVDSPRKYGGHKGTPWLSGRPTGESTRTHQKIRRPRGHTMAEREAIG